MTQSTSSSEPKRSPYTIYCDFDGTIALEDVTDIILDRLADKKWVDIEEEWVRGWITARECMTRQVALINGGWNAVKTVLTDIHLDPSFAPFATWCAKSGIPLIVVSDGLDRVIHHLLLRDKISVDGIRANQLVCSGDRLSLTFPAPHSGTCESGVCKCRVISQPAFPDAWHIIIGDGRSDFCWAKKADIVFAKSKLLDHCRTNDIPCHSFHDFHGIRRILEEMPQRDARPQQPDRNNPICKLKHNHSRPAPKAGQAF